MQTGDIFSSEHGISNSLCCIINTGITEEEKVLSNFVDTGSKLVSLIEEVVTDSESLSSIAGKYKYVDLYSGPSEIGTQ